uniref:D-serine dehydratase-like domain-containing protein n=1 Tax=Globisporangium ultimum (strain ATCC 200006 / CBS 805.95 / DAOM BR144) TaxID=431595 RepID=K3X3B1_GLOUD
MWRASGSSSLAATAAIAATAFAVGGAAARRYLSATAHHRVGASVALARRCPAKAGDTLESVETPCLVVDLDAMEKNLVALPRSLREIAPQVAIRPHAKAHKCAEIGRLQLHYSEAVGLCCQKVAEAEAMFAGGVRDLLLSNEIYGASRYERMAELVKQGAAVTLIFDHAETIRQADAVAAAHGVEFGALVDVNVGQNRCGVDSVDDAVALAQQLQASQYLQLLGIQAYHGSAQHIRSYTEKAKVIDTVAAKAKKVRDAFVKQGLKCDVVTGGGTGTYLLEAQSGVFTEVQPGSYLFNDADYARNLGVDGEKVRQWEQSLFVLTTVMSTNHGANPPRSVVDAGMKAVSLDSGAPLVYSSIDASALPQLEYQGGGDEHGILVPAAGDKSKSEIPMPALGKKLLLTPGHCDPTTNLYDFVVGFRNGTVEHVWEVAARGPGN